MVNFILKPVNVLENSFSVLLNELCLQLNVQCWFLLLSSLFQSSHAYFHSAYLVKFEIVDLEHAWEECYIFLGHGEWGGDEKVSIWLGVHCFCSVLKLRCPIRYQGFCLLDAIDFLQLPSRDVSKPLIIPICDVIKSQSTGQLAAYGKLETGAIQIGSKVYSYGAFLPCRCFKWSTIALIIWYD